MLAYNAAEGFHFFFVGRRGGLVKQARGKAQSTLLKSEVQMLSHRSNFILRRSFFKISHADCAQCCVSNEDAYIHRRLRRFNGLGIFRETTVFKFCGVE